MKPVDHMRARPFQLARLADVGGLVEPRLQLHQRGDGFAVLRRLAKRLDDGAVARGAVERLFDRHHLRVARGLRQKPHHHIERLVGVVQQHVLLPDRGEHVAFMVLHPLGYTWCEAGPQQIRSVFQHQFAEVRDTDHGRRFRSTSLGVTGSSSIMT